MILTERAADFMNRSLGVAAGVTISYARIAGGSAINITDAVPGRSTQSSQAGPGEPVTRYDLTERDYLIPADSLGYEPAQGDRITQTINGTSYTFEVKPNAGLKAWDWSDTQRTRYRVRCKRVVS